MSKQLKDKLRWWALVGVPTIFIGGLIIYGNFFSSSSHLQRFTWEQQPYLYVCSTAPKWASPDSGDFMEAIGWWKQQGFEFKGIERGPCPDTCSFTDKNSGRERWVPCNKGKVTLDLRGRGFSEEHAGECISPGGKLLGQNDWTTILLPNVIYGSDDMDADMLPVDVQAQVLAHEIGHCLVGVGHNRGPVIGCTRLNSKSGSIMHPTIYGGGWINEGLPSPPARWKGP